MKIKESNREIIESMQPSNFMANNTDDDKIILCQKVDFMFHTMAIHIDHVFSITESYVNRLKIAERSHTHCKRELFNMITVKDDYAYCVNSIRTLLKLDDYNSVEVIPACIIDCYKHQLVLQIASDNKSVKRYLRILEIYSMSQPNNKLTIKRWRYALNEFNALDYLVDV
jgi:hypothetical protein